MGKSTLRKKITAVTVFMVTLSLVVGSVTACGPGEKTSTPATSTMPTSTPQTTTSLPTSTVPHPGLALVNFDSGSFAGSSNCALCHSSLQDEVGNDVSMDSHWRSTMMANAARDPYYRAKVSAEIKNAPHLQEVIEDVCGTCHTPMAHTQAIADGTQPLLFGDGFLNTSSQLHNAGIDGVSCTFCHQVQAEGLGGEETFSGGYVVDTSTVAPNRLIFSQFEDPDQQMMMAGSGFKPVEGKHLGESGLCATCHTVITPFIDSEGEVQGTFPEQTPYLEWLHSSYPGEKECQTCHMPYAEGNVKTSNIPPHIDAKGPFSQHYFVGGNTHMMKILRDNPDDLAVTSSTEQFNNTIDRAAQQLRQDTASVSIIDSGLSGDNLSFTVKVEDYTGHKLPTGFPSRRVWLHLQVLDKDGKVVFESGKPNSDGTISGNSADSDIYTHEPHYDLITSSDQVQIYEAILRDMEGDVTHKLLEASGYAKDNRLLPAGFDKNTAGEMFAVWGDALQDDNFIGGSDTVTYQVDTSSSSGPFTVKAALMYQSMAYSTIQSIIDVDTPQVKEFKSYWDSSDKSSEMIAFATEEIS
ncbi:MAG: hypothetical protein WCS74_02145 [Dehalococcoidales bacterium]|jgi:hypothetical protein|nr:hypothetical protein [Dehalococcoidales bacterium]MDD3264409.1 hypothetical protein [Dehalococcoidales bacterium]MDD4321950.1 hypothetical protein [Dehalococcoidales bacterium]MDD4794035.1 hypothetical protein [Dehalococcoidales bacterium]MDD5122749.1 hypothetical protein [Dehalococcoidales bacterium]